jgi:hypothetical protein
MSSAVSVKTVVTGQQLVSVQKRRVPLTIGLRVDDVVKGFKANGAIVASVTV